MLLQYLSLALGDKHNWIYYKMKNGEEEFNWTFRLTVEFSPVW